MHEPSPLPSPAAGRLAQIWSAPVKGLALTAHDEVTLEPGGIPGDRAFAMLDGQGRLANGKRFGPMAAIRATLTREADGERLALRWPDGTVVEAPVVLGRPVDAIFYGHPRAAHEVSGVIAEALSEAAGQRIRLVRMDEDGAGLDRADEGGAVSIMSVAALEALAAAAGLDQAVDARRFRMSFVVDGVPAHAEDRWIGQRVRIGEAVVRPGGNIGRCAVTTQDPDTGRPSLDTLRLIAETRGHLPASEPLPFGVWAEVLVPGRVRVGDPVVPDPAER